MLNGIISAKIELKQEECYCGIPEFYDMIAQKLGYDPQKVQYDCTKICVSKPVQDQIFSYYETENNASEEALGSTWVRFGPKTNLPHSTYIVDIQRGFITEVL